MNLYLHELVVVFQGATPPETPEHGEVTLTPVRNSTFDGMVNAVSYDHRQELPALMTRCIERDGKGWVGIEVTVHRVKRWGEYMGTSYYTVDESFHQDDPTPLATVTEVRAWLNRPAPQGFTRIAGKSEIANPNWQVVASTSHTIGQVQNARP